MKLSVNELEKLIDEYGDYIYGFCLKLTLDRNFADELYQNTFLKAVEIIDRINNDSAKSYIIGIAIKLWKAQKRKNVIRNKIAFFISSDDDNYVEVCNENSSLDDLYIQKEQEDEVAKIVFSMKDKIKLPIIMFYNLDMSIEEISEILNIPKGTVKSRLNRGRNMVKSALLEVKL